MLSTAFGFSDSTKVAEFNDFGLINILYMIKKLTPTIITTS